MKSPLLFVGGVHDSHPRNSEISDAWLIESGTKTADSGSTTHPERNADAESMAMDSRQLCFTGQPRWPGGARESVKGSDISQVRPLNRFYE